MLIGFHQQLLVGRAARNGPAVHAVDDGFVHLQLFGRLALYHVENHVLGKLIVARTIVLELLHFFFENRGFLLVAYHLDDVATSRHTQFRKEIAYQLNVAIIHPVENHRVNIVDDYNAFIHNAKLILFFGSLSNLPQLIFNYIIHIVQWSFVIILPRISLALSP